MTVPDTVRVGHRRYTIDLVDRLTERGESGVTFHESRRIEVADNLAAEPEREVVLHETLHAVMEYVGVNYDYAAEDPPGEEQLVTRLAPALLALLVDNPRLVGYLVEGSA